MTSAALPLRERTEARAIASLILGIAGLVFFPLIPSIFAIALGHSARRRIRENAGLKGDTLATVGVVLGWVGVVIGVAILLVLAFFLAPASQSPA